MSWQDLLEEPKVFVLPWVGGREMYGWGRYWEISGRLPPEHGWYPFYVNGGRRVRFHVGEACTCPQGFEDLYPTIQGYLIGDHLIPDQARSIEQAFPVFLVEPGLARFARARVIALPNGNHLFFRQEFPQGPEAEVERAYQDRLENVSSISCVTPALDLAFQWLSRQRFLSEERRRQIEKLRVEEERRQQEAERLSSLRQNMGSAEGRRALASQDFESAARGALAISNSELLDFRPGYERGEMIVQYRVRHRRLECIVDKETLRVLDAGVCLNGYDKLFTLESLPSVVEEALDTGLLHVYRHGQGDEDD